MSLDVVATLEIDRAPEISSLRTNSSRPTIRPGSAA